MKYYRVRSPLPDVLHSGLSAELKNAQHALIIRRHELEKAGRGPELAYMEATEDFGLSYYRVDPATGELLDV